MKFVAGLVLIVAFGQASGQTILLPDEAIKAIYGDFDPTMKTAPWSCPADYETAKEGPCPWVDDGLKRVSVEVVKSVQIQQADGYRTYVVTSATPFQAYGKYDCHACWAEMAVAIFVYRDARWVVENSNRAAIQFGAWGQADGNIDVIAIGRSLYGVMFTRTDGNQGYLSTVSSLLAADGKTVKTIWSFEGNENNDGAYDPHESYADHVHASVSRAYRFAISDSAQPDHYDIELISRGYSEQKRRLRPENWKELYRFKNGRYQLLKRTEFHEAPTRRR